MNFNRHSELAGKHAFLSASQYHWLNYDADKVAQVFVNEIAKRRGTKLHEFAASAIELREKLRSCHKTLNMYVNDAIGYKMTPEQVLYYSRHCFGTTDAISFRKEGRADKPTLRIHDLKTGVIPAHMEQLMIYAALFCLEYDVNPEDIYMELRIYQLDDIITYIPEPAEIAGIMNKIVEFDQILDNVAMQEG